MMALALVVVAWFIALRREVIKKFLQRPVYIGLSILESLFYALLLGLFVGKVTGLFLQQYSGKWDQTKIATLVMNLGSGIYEECFFRLLLVTGLVLFLNNVTSQRRYVSYSIAIIVSSLIFAYSHHLSVFNEPLNYPALLFRFFAGIVFAFLFIFRGYGIAAYTHSFYNIFLMFR